MTCPGSSSRQTPPSSTGQFAEKLTFRMVQDSRLRSNALRSNTQDIKEQYERQLKELQEAYGEAMLELRARKKLQSLLGEDELNAGKNRISSQPATAPTWGGCPIDASDVSRSRPRWRA